ncbi:Cellulase (glycosyl hydrolase family 5) [Micromonospora mirobrigensis]|uniref:Cellulase (Glycosyl hydrolase family 5) n=1 Tax=Micromonospora mirobrigensis TaxID=262898 RepID=A0A1C4WRS4_9ACTN|nr:Cellulase (glycosyl hydrolase family 5) [Micromonospora mirobrigensis]
MTASATPPTSGPIRRGRVTPLLLALSLLAALLSGVPTRGGEAPAPVAVTTDTFNRWDVGFAEGAGLNDADLARRLDGMVSYLPGRSPLLRIDLDWWYVQDCRRCALRWDRLDPVLAAAKARGIRVLLMLGYAPPWANGGHGSDKWFPTSDADWTAIVEATVRHVGDTVVAYEVWNEPNNSATTGYEGFGNYDGDRRARYWQLVRLAATTVRALCPTCVVLAGASGAGTPNTATANPNESGAWLDWAYGNGYGTDFDAVAHHPYPAWSAGKGPADPECATRWWNLFGPPGTTPACGELAYLRSIMVKWGDGAKKIWATEYGYPTAGATGLPITAVRDHLVEGVSMWRSLPYAGPLFLYSYRDACVSTGDPECNFGVVTRDLTPKAGLHDDLRDALTEAWRPALRSGERIRRWASLLSVDGGYQLNLQGDGNLVVYRRHDAATWASGTHDGVVLINQDDGNLVLYRTDGTPAWSSGTWGNGPSTLWMQEDGNLVLYRDGDGAVTWASGSTQG